MKPTRPSTRTPSARASRARTRPPAGSNDAGPNDAGPTPAVSLTSRGLLVGGVEVPLLAGAMHYFRVEPEAWRPALASLRELGLPIVETYVPWGVHEIAPGNYDFGRVDPKKDLRAFLDAAKEEGLFVWVRPGPHINAEMTWFGLPERIVYDKACQARSPQQGPVVQAFPPRMFPVPSYASQTFRDETARWYRAVADQVRDYLYPAGPIVLLQVDNEAAYYFRDGTYEQDYHPDAIAKLRAWTLARHGSLEATSRVHRTSYASPESIEAPVRFDVIDEEDAQAIRAGLPRHLEWGAFREDLITEAVRTMKGLLADVGLTGVPTTHNLPLGELSAPMSLPDLEDVVDVVGLDYYHARREHRVVKRRTLYVAGSSRLAISPEMGVGAPPWFTPLAHEDSLYTAMVGAAYGLRGMSLYMAVDRDRWYGAPIDAMGRPRPEAGAWKRFLHGLRDVGHAGLVRRAKVGLMLPREYVRLSRATHLLGPLSPVTLEAVGMSPVEASSDDPLSFDGPIQVLWWKLIARFADALTALEVPYVLLDGDAREAQLAAFDVLVVPSFDYASTERWATLGRVAEAGTHVVYGPALPGLDENFEPHAFVAPKGATRVLVDTDDDALAIVAKLVEAKPSLALDVHAIAVGPAGKSAVEVTVHEDPAAEPGSAPRVVFVMNPGREPVHAKLTRRGAWAPADDGATWTVDDVMSGQRYPWSSTLELELAGGSIRMLRVLDGDASAPSRDDATDEDA